MWNSHGTNPRSRTAERQVLCGGLEGNSVPLSSCQVIRGPAVSSWSESTLLHYPSMRSSFIQYGYTIRSEHNWVALFAPQHVSHIEKQRLRIDLKNIIYVFLKIQNFQIRRLNTVIIFPLRDKCWTSNLSLGWPYSRVDRNLVCEFLIRNRWALGATEN